MNTIEYIRILEAVGVSRAQAEAHAEGLSEFMETKFATKQDLKDMSNRISTEMQEIRYEIKEMRLEMKALELRMTVRLGSIMAAGIALLHFFK